MFGTYLCICAVFTAAIGAVVAIIRWVVTLFRERKPDVPRITRLGFIVAWVSACFLFGMVMMDAGDYVTDNTDLSSQTDDLQQQLTEQQEQFADLQSQYNALNAEYEQYKTEMQSYAEQKQAEEEQRRAELDAEAELGYETGITFENLARDPDEYEGRKVKFSGRVVQVIDGGTQVWRVAVDEDYGQMIMCVYTPIEGESRILEDDYITLYGVSQGLQSYTSTFGGEITLPLVTVDQVELNQ